MKTTWILLLAGVLASAFKADDADKIVKVAEFQEFIKPFGLVFEMPEDYKETFVKENHDLWYSFAIKDEKADFEVRYTVSSLEGMMEEYRKCELDKHCTMVHPNSIYKGTVWANVLNMTGGNDAPIAPFPEQAVKKEFNADAGGSSFFEFKCAFGTGYKYGQMIYLHKDDKADVIITYLSNDRKTHSELMGKSFHALRFE